jgi:hypothetical protein
MRMGITLRAVGEDDRVSLIPQLMSPTSSMFLVPETRDQPMHVGGLQLFETPDGAGRDYLQTLYHEAIAQTDVAPLFRRTPYRSVATRSTWSTTSATPRCRGLAASASCSRCRHGCMARCSTGTGRCGRRTSSRGWRTAVSPSTPRCTTR